MQALEIKLDYELEKLDRQTEAVGRLMAHFFSQMKNAPDVSELDMQQQRRLAKEIMAEKEAALDKAIKGK